MEEKKKRKRVNLAACISVSPEDPHGTYSKFHRAKFLMLKRNHEELISTNLYQEIIEKEGPIVLAWKEHTYGLYICGKLQPIEDREEWNWVLNEGLNFGFLDNPGVRYNSKMEGYICEK